MDEKEFLDFSAARYDRVLESSETIYNRYGFIVTVIAGTGAASYASLTAVSNAELKDGLGAISFLFGCLALVFLMTGVGLLMASIWPKKYSELAAMIEFAEWRTGRAKALETDPGVDPASTSSQLGLDLVRALLTRVHEGESRSLKARNRRMLFYNITLRLTCAALIALGIQLVLLTLLQRLTANDATKPRSEQTFHTNSATPTA